MSKRPWKKHALIFREELNSGDVKFRIQTKHNGPHELPGKTYESLDAAVADLDAWWGTFWPKQVKRWRRV